MRCAFVLPAAAALGILACLAPAARGQVPFMSSTGSAFEPEISVVQSGVLSDVQATVSADRKYVTLTMRSTQSTLIALRDFTFQTSNSTPAGSGGTAGSGFVGMSGTGGTDNIAGGGANAGANGGNNGNTAHAQAQRATASPPPQPTVLDREGMTRIELRGPTRRPPQTPARSPARTQAGGGPGHAG